MLPDLTRALLAALAAGVLPGWFWAGCLWPAHGRAGRVACSMALSMVLVPTVALLAAYLLGTGVTLTVAVISVLVVFLGGLAAHLAFGRAKTLEEPLHPGPAPLGAPALLLLVPAFGLALAAYFGILDGTRSMLPIAVLLVFAGAVQLFRRGGVPDGLSPELRDGTLARGARRFALPAVLGLVLFRGYSGPVMHDWPYLRGGDQFFHAMMANMMLGRGEIEPYAVYPPGLHTLNAVISRLSGLEPLDLFPLLAPALLALPALALYVLAARMWGWEYGVAAALFVGLLSNGAYHYLSYQAMYPTVVSAEFLLVVAVAALFGLFASPTARSGLLFALLGSSVILYHPVGSLYAALLFGLVGLLIVPYLLLRERRTGVALVGSFALLGALAVAYAWDTYDLPDAVAGLLEGSGSTAGGEAVSMAVGTQAPLALPHLLVTITHPVLWLGLLGAVLLVTSGGRRTDLTRPPAASLAASLAGVTLLLWGLMLFVGSRTAYSGFPERFERDLAVPLALLAAFALGAVLRSLRIHASVGSVPVLALCVIVAVGSLAMLQAARNLSDSVGPSKRVVLTPEIVAAGEWLEARNRGGNIMIAPRGNQVTGRAMLALSGYNALEAFTATRIEYNRDLPPYGAEPLKDVLYVIKTPDETSRPLLEKYDIRYVVFYKRFGEGTTWDRTPVQDWRGHKANTELYRVAFENEYVIILEPRPSA